MSGGGQATVLEVIADLQPVWANDPPFGVAERCMHAFYLDGRSFVPVFRPRTRLRPFTFYQKHKWCFMTSFKLSARAWPRG